MPPVYSNYNPQRRNVPSFVVLSHQPSTVRPNMVPIFRGQLGYSAHPVNLTNASIGNRHGCQSYQHPQNSGIHRTNNPAYPYLPYALQPSHSGQTPRLPVSRQVPNYAYQQYNENPTNLLWRPTHRASQQPKATQQKMSPAKPKRVVKKISEGITLEDIQNGVEVASESESESEAESYDSDVGMCTIHIVYYLEKFSYLDITNKLIFSHHTSCLRPEKETNTQTKSKPKEALR